MLPAEGATTAQSCDRTSGWVSSVERGCLHDGPGLRTTVFLKGCPLRCAWCHNPETQRQRPELFFHQERCTACGDCAAACPLGCHRLPNKQHRIDRAACVGCGLCSAACPADALRLNGRRRRVDELIALAQRDRAFYGEDGGLTISGGEPLAQPDFTRALLQAAGAAGLHRCLETSAYGRRADLLALVPLVELFLVDWKVSDPRRHRASTGVDPAPIRANLQALAAAGARIRLRCPVVPGINDRPEHFFQTAALAAELSGCEAIELLAYHPLGASKCARLGRPFPMAEQRRLEPGELAGWRALLRRHSPAPVL